MMDLKNIVDWYLKIIALFEKSRLPQAAVMKTVEESLTATLKYIVVLEELCTRLIIQIK